MSFLLLSDPRVARAWLRLPKGKVRIYALVDPYDSTVRYVGKTTSPGRRLGLHMELKQSNFLLTEWLRGLKDAGTRPIMHILQKVARDRWEEAERHWITFFRDAATLYN